MSSAIDTQMDCHPGLGVSPVDLRWTKVFRTGGRCLKYPLRLAIRGAIAKHFSAGWLEVPIEFADHQTALRGSSSSDVAIAFYSAFLANKWGFNPLPVARHLVELSSTLNRRLQAAYEPYEFSGGRVGGWTGLKEVVLYLVVRGMRPDVIVETGVAQGVSSSFILSALDENGKGRLHSIDLPHFKDSISRMQERRRAADRVYVRRDLGTGWLVPEELRTKWTLTLDSSKNVLPGVKDSVDLFFHDSSHTYENMTFEFEWAQEHTRRGSVLVSDDIDRNTAFSDFLVRHSGCWQPISVSRVGVALRKE